MPTMHNRRRHESMAQFYGSLLWQIIKYIVLWAVFLALAFGIEYMWMLGMIG